MKNDLEARLEDVATLSGADRIDAACDAFESVWLRGTRPRIADYLGCCEAPQQATLFVELVLLDVDYRRRRGERPIPADYLDPHPEFAAQIEALDFTQCLDDTSIPQAARTVATPLGLGSRLAHFRILEQLGAGASGSVWKAEDTRLQRIVALKVPQASQLSEHELHRFLREGRTAAQLRHPHLVTVHEVARMEHTAFIVSDFIDGQDLRKCLKAGRPEWRVTAEWCSQIADALEHAHRRGVVHRDLKPANVVIDQRGQAHVTDFGLAKWSQDARELTLEGQLLGTPAYMSPEQARGDSQRVDHRTDVYALGAMLYELLTGQCPFDGDQAAVLYAIQSAEPRSPRSRDRAIPRDLETICLKALRKEPEHRYQSAQEMLLDLRRFLADEPIRARPISRLTKGRRWIGRHPGFVSTLLLAGVTLASFALLSIVAQQNRDLRGLRPVMLSTQPSGARVAFVRIDPARGTPDPDTLTTARGRSPVRLDLRPGQYLVTAVMEDGRFQEVFRSVPSRDQNLSGAFPHIRWHVAPDGALCLAAITIPDRSITDAMARVAGGRADSVSGAMGVLATPEAVPDFFLDCREATLADYRRAFDGGTPKDLRWKPVPEDWAVTLNYDHATAVAETLGKRLPTEEEYELANARLARASASDDDPVRDARAPQGFGRVGTPDSEHSDSRPPVYGLRSNVAEWTSSIPRDKLGHSLSGTASSLRDHRLVRGGDDAVVRGERLGLGIADSESRVAVPRHFLSAGVGFRCVRSVRPRFIPESWYSE